MFTHLNMTRFSNIKKHLVIQQKMLDTIIAPMAIDGKEPIGSMGTDVPLAVLSDQPQHLRVISNNYLHR